MAKHYNFIYEELVRYEGDLVGRVAYSLYKREKIAFIEVKTRLSKAFGDGKEAVNLQKQNRIKRAAGYFLSHTRAFYRETDFQVVEIQLTHMTNLIF